MRQNPSAAAFVSAVTAASNRLADRVTALATAAGEPARTHEPFSDMPTPPADADLNATEGVLMAGVIGELRVIASAVAVLERIDVRPTRHEVADQAKEDQAKGS